MGQTLIRRHYTHRVLGSVCLRLWSHEIWLAWKLVQCRLPALANQVVQIWITHVGCSARLVCVPGLGPWVAEGLAKQADGILIIRIWVRALCVTWVARELPSNVMFIVEIAAGSNKLRWARL